MKTLNDHVILYDNECPMCDLYTRAFVKSKMLNTNGRIAFTQAGDLISTHQVDRAKACDEIALVNLKTGKVDYGVESLTRILGNRFNFLQPLFESPLFLSLIKKVYSFISFNRKVIIPGKDINNAQACRPGFSLRYRVLYLALTWLATSFVLANYASVLQPLIPPTNFYREFIICGGQIVFQAIVVCILDRKKSWEYLGNMMTISVAGALLLGFALTLTPVLHPVVFVAIFVCVVALMFFEHIRRVKLLNLPWVMTLSWVLYRVLVLAVIL